MKRQGLVIDGSTKIVFGGNVRWVIFCRLREMFKNINVCVRVCWRGGVSEGQISI